MKRSAVIKRIMAEKNLNAMRVAEMANIPYTTFKSMLSRGIGGASVDNVIKVCKALDITVDELETMSNDQGQESPKTEVEEYMDMLRYRPEMRMLFSVSKKATKAEIEQVANMMEAFKKQSEE